MNLEIWKTFENFGKKIRNVEKGLKFVRIWKFGENLEIWNKFGNLEQIWKFENIWKFGKN